MTWVDYAVLGVLVLSALLGLWRGFVREVLSLIGWIAAAVLALWLTPDVAAWLPEGMGSAFVRHALAALLIFVAVLLFAALVGFLLRKALKALGLSALDRALGGAFGLARGILLVAVAVTIAGLTDLPRDTAWREARLRGPLETAGVVARNYLPQAIAARVRYEGAHEARGDARVESSGS